MQGVPASPARSHPLYLLRWRAMAERRPLPAAVLLGSSAGLAGLLCAFVVGKAVLYFMPPELWGNSAAAGLGRLGWGWAFFLAVVFAPLFETAVGQVLPMELVRRLGARPGFGILLSGLVFGVGHYLNGGLAHGVTTFVGGLVFACAYAALRPTGIGPAFVAAATAHAVQNGLVLSLILFEFASGA